MTNYLDMPITVCAINGSLTNAFRESVIRRALDNLDNVSDPARNALKTVVRKHAKVPGFKNPALALNSPKRAIVIAQMIGAFALDASLVSVVLKVWDESHAELHDAVKAFLLETDPTFSEPAAIIAEFPAVWSSKAMDEVTNDFLAAHPLFEKDDAALMLCYISGRMPLDYDSAENPIADDEFADDEEPGTWGTIPGQQPDTDWAVLAQEADTMTVISPFLSQVLASIEALPANAPEWDQMPAFTVRLRALTEGRLMERDQGREQLRQALAVLAEEAGLALGWWDYDVSHWSAERCSWDEAVALAEAVRDWQSLLQQHLAVQQKPASNRAESIERREKLNALEAAIQRDYLVLDAALGSSPAPTTPFDEPDGSQPAEPEHALVAEEKEATEETLEPIEEPANHMDEGEDAAPTTTLAELVVELSEPEAVPENTRFLESTIQAHTDSPDRRVETPEEIFADLVPSPTADEATNWSDHEVAGERVESAIEEDVWSMDDLPAQEQLADDDQSAQQAPIVAAEPWIDEPERAAESELTAGEPALEHPADADTEWTALLASLLADDDLAGAYWLTKSLQAMHEPTPIPEWLLAAVQVSRFVTDETSGLVRDLVAISANHQAKEESPVHGLLTLAAALRPALVAPYSSMSGWLITPSVCPPLRELVQAISAFVSFNVSLHREDVHGVSGVAQRQEAIATVSRETRSWLEEAPSRKKRITSVWRLLVGPRGALREFLAPVCDNKATQVEQVRAGIEYWTNRSNVYARFDEMNKAFCIGAPQPVVGSGKMDLYKDVERAVELAELWCGLVERARNIEAHGNWFAEQVTSLRKEVMHALPAIDSALKELTQRSQPPLLASSARVLDRSLSQLRDLLDLPGSSKSADDSLWISWITPSAAETADAIMSHRLLWLPEVSLTDSGIPGEDDLPFIAPALVSAAKQERSLAIAAEMWLSRQDFRFMDRLLTALPDGSTKLQSRYDEALAASRAKLRSAIDETGDMVEQALLNGAISDEQRATFDAPLTLLSVDDVRNFGRKLMELEGIRSGVSAAYKDRLRYLRLQHETVAAQLKASHIPPELQRDALAFVASAIQREDVRVATEAVWRLQEVLDTGGDLRDDWYAPASERDFLEEFNTEVPRIERWLENSRGNLQALATASREGATAGGVPFGSFSRPHRKESAEAVEAWRSLKQGNSKGRYNPDLIATVLRFLGFDLNSIDTGAVTVSAAGEDWLHVRAVMAAGHLARPIPEFGSQAKGRYDIVCIWDRRSPGSIAAFLQNLNLDIHPVIVLYLGRLTPKQRRDGVRVVRDKALDIAILDETMLVFLAQEPEPRLSVFLRCALPYSAINPYRPFQAGDVPPELFYGRETMARELLRPGGSYLVYGGRQLGKSALLRHVERQFHHPEREQYAWVENMKLVFDPQAGKDAKNLWRTLSERFKAHGLFDLKVHIEKPETIARYIREGMEARPKQQVIAMLDEADEFLDADSADGFRVVIALKDLMLNTGGRFKVIFAGLQSVQRFQGIPNQPLAHFGTPLCVGPLEPKEAQLLVRQPLEALGFRFVDDGAVLRILSYTNYHPGLIQLFCQELLKKLRDRTRTAVPPYFIRQQDIENVYQSAPMRDRIRERFEWTVALDMHYQAIAWTLIEDQAKERNGFARAYRPSEILQLVRDWWPAGFADTGTDQLRGWLDELCGLGVLVRNNATGHYRLRSPNMVGLLGKEMEIEERLLELAERPPTLPMEADSHHAPLDEEASRYSPLTYADERSLTLARSGVGLVFASGVLGASQLRAAIRRLLPSDLPNEVGDCTEIPSSTSGDRLKDWLRRHVDKHPKTERMIVYQQMPYAAPREMAYTVNLAQRFCRGLQIRNRWLRVIFLLDHWATWRWIELPSSERLALEEASDAALWCRPWTLSAVRRRLAQHEKWDDANASASQQVLKATGGWPYLLDVLLQRCGKETDTRPIAHSVGTELLSNGSQLNLDFRSQLGISENEVAQRILNFVISNSENTGDEQQLGLEYLEPDLIGGQPELTSEQRTQALEYLQRLGMVRIRYERVVIDPLVVQVMAPA